MAILKLKNLTLHILMLGKCWWCFNPNPASKKEIRWSCEKSQRNYSRCWWSKIIWKCKNTRGYSEVDQGYERQHWSESSCKFKVIYDNMICIFFNPKTAKADQSYYLLGVKRKEETRPNCRKKYHDIEPRLWTVQCIMQTYFYSLSCP